MKQVVGSGIRAHGSCSRSKQKHIESQNPHQTYIGIHDTIDFSS